MDSNLAAYAAYEAEKRRQAEQQQQNQPNLIDALGKLALGAGAVAAGAYGVRRMLQPGAVAPSKAPPSTATVRRAAGAVPEEVVRQQRGIELTRQARAERMPGVIQTDLSALQRESSELADQINAAERVLADPEMQSLVQQQRAQELSEARSYQSKAQAEYRNLLSSRADEAISALRKEANTVQAAGQEDFAGQYLRNQGYLETNTLVDQQQGRIFGQVDHFANAANSAEDQATGRVKRAIQRNEDANLAAVEMAEDAVDSQLARIAQQSPDAAATIEVDAAINEAASRLPDGLPIDQSETLIGPVSAQEMVEQAKQEMIGRRLALEEAGLRPGTVRFERALAQPFRTSTATQVRGTGAVETSLPTGPIRQTVQGVSATEQLPESLVSNIGPEAVVTKTAAGTAIRGASPSYYEALPKTESRLLYGTAEPLVPGAPEQLGQDIPGSLRVRGNIPPAAAPEQLSKQEIVYGSLDRPGTPEIPGGSAGIGVYGIESGYVPGAMSKTTGEYSAAAERRPTQPTFKERKTGFEGLTSEQLLTGAQQAKSPGLKAAFEAEASRRATTKSSLEVSEALRRARIEGRDPQEFLRRFGAGQ